MTFRRRLGRRLDHVRRRMGAVGGWLTTGPRGVYVYEARITRFYTVDPLDCRRLTFTRCLFEGRVSSRLV